MRTAERSLPASWLTQRSREPGAAAARDRGLAPAGGRRAGDGAGRADGGLPRRHPRGLGRHPSALSAGTEWCPECNGYRSSLAERPSAAPAAEGRFCRGRDGSRGSATATRPPPPQPRWGPDRQRAPARLSVARWHPPDAAPALRATAGSDRRASTLRGRSWPPGVRDHGPVGHDRDRVPGTLDEAKPVRAPVVGGGDDDA
jgi:hypothetical protein